jgi:hypothetical protein
MRLPSVLPAVNYLSVEKYNIVGYNLCENLVCKGRAFYEQNL